MLQGRLHFPGAVRGFSGAVTHLFDRGIYVTLGALLAIMSGDPGRFWMRDNADGVAVALALATLAAFVLDQFVFMAVYGVTFSKWIMGYRLRRKEGRPPGFVKAFFWNVVVEPIEVITLGIVSLILILKRSDRATLHDLVLGTRAVRVKNKQQGLRLLASAALKNSGFAFPLRPITVNLSPADCPVNLFDGLPEKPEPVREHRRKVSCFR